MNSKVKIKTALLLINCLIVSLYAEELVSVPNEGNEVLSEQIPSQNISQMDQGISVSDANNLVIEKTKERCNSLLIENDSSLESRVDAIQTSLNALDKTVVTLNQASNLKMTGYLLGVLGGVLIYNNAQPIFGITCLGVSAISFPISILMEKEAYSKYSENRKIVIRNLSRKIEGLSGKKEEKVPSDATIIMSIIGIGLIAAMGLMIVR